MRVLGETPGEQENSAESLALIQKVIAEQMPQLQPAPAPGGGAAPGVRDFTLTMAAAAAEVPTTLSMGKSPEEVLKEQIRKALHLSKPRLAARRNRRLRAVGRSK